MQRADSFAIGSGTREKKELEEVEEFGEAFDSVIRKAAEPDVETEDHEKELAEHREQHAQMEAGRRGSSSPSHQPLLGLSILPGIDNPRLAVGEAPESHSKRRSAGVGEEREAKVESVSPEILLGLKRAGLSQPIVTLDDPRLAGSAEGMSAHFVMSLRDHARVYVWSGRSCHQIVTVGLRETSLESAVGTTVETVIRRGRVDQKSVRTRPDSNSGFNLPKDV